MAKIVKCYKTTVELKDCISDIRYDTLQSPRRSNGFFTFTETDGEDYFINENEVVTISSIPKYEKETTNEKDS
jgi:hypothetical protein